MAIIGQLSRPLACLEHHCLAAGSAIGTNKQMDNAFDKAHRQVTSLKCCCTEAPEQRNLPKSGFNANIYINIYIYIRCTCCVVWLSKDVEVDAFQEVNCEVLGSQKDRYKSMLRLVNTNDQSTLSPWPAFRNAAKCHKIACTKGESTDLRTYQQTVNWHCMQF